MRNTIIFSAATALALAGCGGGGGSADSANNFSTGDIDMALGGDEITPLPEDENGLAATTGNAAGPRASTGQDFVRLAAASDLFEMESARLAIAATRNGDVRQFAQMILADHQQATAALARAASQAQPPVPVTPILNPQQRQMLTALRAVQPDAFDRLYLQQQVAAHTEALAALQAYARSGEIPPFRQHASTVAGPVERHLTRARELAAR